MDKDTQTTPPKRKANFEVIVPIAVSTSEPIPGTDFSKDKKKRDAIKPILKAYGFNSARHFTMACMSALERQGAPLLESQNNVAQFLAQFKVQ